MEPDCEKVHERKFALMQIRMELPNGGTRKVPCYSLTKTECLYVATKFNDEARARLVLRWEQLEREQRHHDAVRTGAEQLPTRARHIRKKRSCVCCHF